MKFQTPDGKPISHDLVKSAVQALASKDAGLRSRAVAALALPLKKHVPVESSVRRIFNVITLGMQEDAIYPLDTDDEVEVVLSSAYGVPPVSMFATDTVTIRTDTYQGAWELPEQLVNAGRIDQVARNTRRMLEGFIHKEETVGWAVVAACESVDNTVELESGDTGYGTASIELINEMLIYFQEKGYIPDQCWMSPRSQGDFRKMCKEAGLPNEVRFDLWKNGVITSLWGVDFYALRGLSDEKIYMFDTTRFGAMAVRQDLETREDPSARSEFKVKINGQEQVGFAGVQKDALCVGDTHRDDVA